jgi:alpha-beta hydrolase superfamily lysophospholipase
MPKVTAGYRGQPDTAAAAVTGGAVTGGATAAVRTGAAADVAGLIEAGGVDGAERAADPHAALRQITGRPITATTHFAPTLTGCHELIFEERAARPPLLRKPLEFKDRNEASTPSTP